MKAICLREKEKMKPHTIFFLSFQCCTCSIWRSPARGLIRVVATSLCQSHTISSHQPLPDPGHICDLHHSSWQCKIHNPQSEARVRTHNLMVPSWISFRCVTTEPLIQKKKIIIENLRLGYCFDFWQKPIQSCVERKMIRTDLIFTKTPQLKNINS